MQCNVCQTELTWPGGSTGIFICPRCFKPDARGSLPQSYLFHQGEFTLSHGQQSWFKIVCDNLIESDGECIARMMSRIVGPFSSVEGIPTGGDKLAINLLAYQTEISSGAHCIVDDVLTSGHSMRLAREEWERKNLNHEKESLNTCKYCGKDTTKMLGPVENYRCAARTHRDVKGIVLFARGECPAWIRAVCQLPEELWLPTRPRRENEEHG